MNRLALLLSGALLLGSCLPAADGPVPAAAAESGPTPAPTTPTTTTTTVPPPVCRPDLPAGDGVETLRLGDPARLSVAISARLFSCADRAVVATADDLPALTGGALVAAEAGAPLLVVEPGAETIVADEIGRLGASTVVTAGAVPLLPLPSGIDIVEAHPPPGGIADALARLAGFDVRPLGADLVPLLASRDPGDGPTLVAPWNDPAGALPAAVAAAVTGGRLLLAPPDDLRRDPDVAASLHRSPPSRPVILAGVFGPDAPWQAETVVGSDPLPGGGWTLLPGRRLVALYGNPLTPNLGVLGEQGPLESVARLAPLVEAYGADGTPTVGAFEIIATVADAKPGADGDYSAETPIADIRPWVDAAREAGVYVILDLQPGRTDFLTQAKRYAELLAEPHVGLALDPEWRLGPDQVHLRQIGSVDADEVNQVAEWLAALVEERHLPQKLFLLHQFKPSMITNRDAIETPPQLAVVIQMDGQGPLATKYSSYRVITGNREHPRWWWGWKNFYDEDSPMATPDQVLDLDPVPVYVSFQ